MPAKNILTPLNSRWEDFQGAMHSHLNLQDATLDGEYTVISSCDSTYRITRNVLTAHFAEFDTEATLDYFRKSGWNCDCQVYLESPEYLGITQVDREKRLLKAQKKSRNAKENE